MLFVITTIVLLIILIASYFFIYRPMRKDYLDVIKFSEVVTEALTMKNHVVTMNPIYNHPQLGNVYCVSEEIYNALAKVITTKIEQTNTYNNLMNDE